MTTCRASGQPLRILDDGALATPLRVLRTQSVCVPFLIVVKVKGDVQDVQEPAPAGLPPVVTWHS